ncbi:Mbeg1-like protein [Campylobacter hominis]
MNTLENTITTMGLLSKEAYNVGNFQIGAEITANNQTYKVIDYVSTASDFQALLLQDKSGKFVMAFRGTEQHSISDWLNDVSIGFKNINEQYNDAKEFLEKAIKDYGVTIDNLTLTGHSLGGILTQQVGATYGIKGYAFNPYGTDRLLSLPESPFDGITSNFLYGLLTSLAEKVMSAVGLTKANAQWAYEHIYNISYQDEGLLNGDILSNLATELSSNHLGHFIPILGENVGFGEGHYMETLNKAISQYNDIVQKFDNSCRYEDITQMYLSTAIIHGSGYKKVRDEFKKLGILNENGANDKIANNSLHLEVITKDTDTTSIFSGSNLSVAELYALVNFNPFIVSNINSNAYDEIEKFKDEYSENYIKDKAKMFSELLGNHNGANLGTYYKDLQSGKELDLTQDFNGYYDEIVFGTNSNDNITNLGSKSGEHKLYTLAGDDTIKLTGGSNYKFINLNLLVA